MSARRCTSLGRAFTLVELLGAVLLLGVALPPLMIAIRDGTVRQAAQNQRVVARWLAQGKLEEIIADRHSTAVGRGYANVLTATYTAENPVSGFSGFSRSVTVAERNHTLSAAGTGYKLVTVTVSWMDVTRGSSSLSLQTVVTDY
jgi:hypothetical protein